MGRSPIYNGLGAGCGAAPHIYLSHMSGCGAPGPAKIASRAGCGANPAYIHMPYNALYLILLAVLGVVAAEAVAGVVLHAVQIFMRVEQIAVKLYHGNGNI